MATLVTKTLDGGVHNILTTGKLPVGSSFTIEGCGKGSKGQTVINGYNVATKRKCKAKTLTVYKVTDVLK